MSRAWTLGTRAVLAAALLVVCLVPVLFSTFFTSAVALTTLWLGLCAVSLTFLSGSGGMVSLTQTALFGVAGLISAKLTVELGWNGWTAALVGIGAAFLVGLVFGAVASGSLGIYFLMITLAFAEITYYYFAAVPTFGAHEGINEFRPPAPLGDPVLHPARMYYFTLAVCALVYLFLRYLSGTAFGLALQGVRDDPVRMAARRGGALRVVEHPDLGGLGLADRRHPGADRGRDRWPVPVGGRLGRRVRLHRPGHLRPGLERPLRHLAGGHLPGDRAALAGRAGRRPQLAGRPGAGLAGQPGARGAEHDDG